MLLTILFSNARILANHVLSLYRLGHYGQLALCSVAKLVGCVVYILILLAPFGLQNKAPCRANCVPL
ncbi:MAG: hypothetical protein ACI883_000452 [Candidatus Azotimanducaceae bacterium]|jgi:uncharacterized protein YqgC (DUF456 family)